MAYGDFKTKFEVDAIADVIAKRNPNAVAEVTGNAPADLSSPSLFSRFFSLFRFTRRQSNP
jgi:hypothetical protein